MTIPHLLLRKLGRNTEVVFNSAGDSQVLFSGARWPARRFLLELRNEPKHRETPTFCQKKNGALVASPHGQL